MEHVANTEKTKLNTQELFEKYCIKRTHSKEVQRVSILIFEEVNRKIKELSPELEEILNSATLLHDIGYSKSDGKDHNKYSAQIVKEEGLSDFSEEQTEIISLICLYHRGKLPDKHEDFEYGKLDKKERKIVKRLCGILKIADSFSDTDILNIKDIKIEYNKENKSAEIYIILYKSDKSIDILKVIKKKELFEIGFKTQIIFKIWK